jgi:tetratricopeptide (TPR) repeat protein
VSEEEFRSKRPVLRVEAVENHTRGLIATAPDQKMKLFAQAVRIDPRHSPASFELGRLYWEKQNWKQAADHFRRVAVWDIRYREALFYLGLCKYRLNDYAGAEAAFRTVADAVPLNEVWNNLAAAQSRRNSREALANFSKALEGDPGDPDYHFNVGYTLFKSGDLSGAAERFRAVLDRHPEDTEALTMLGRCLAKSGRGQAGAAVEGLERLKETYEESAWLQLKAVLEPKR